MRSRVAHGGLHGVGSDIWIVRQNIFDRIAMLDATEHGINSHSRAANDWRAALDAGINDNEWIVLALMTRSYSRWRSNQGGWLVPVELNLNSLT
jgi:hypothetical protein